MLCCHLGQRTTLPGDICVARYRPTRAVRRHYSTGRLNPRNCSEEQHKKTLETLSGSCFGIATWALLSDHPLWAGRTLVVNVTWPQCAVLSWLAGRSCRSPQLERGRRQHRDQSTPAHTHCMAHVHRRTGTLLKGIKFFRRVYNAVQLSSPRETWLQRAGHDRDGPQKSVCATWPKRRSSPWTCHRATGPRPAQIQVALLQFAKHSGAGV